MDDNERPGFYTPAVGKRLSAIAAGEVADEEVLERGRQVS
jgi:hypothetical protein